MDHQTHTSPTVIRLDDRDLTPAVRQAVRLLVDFAAAAEPASGEPATRPPAIDSGDRQQLSGSALRTALERQARQVCQHDGVAIVHRPDDPSSDSATIVVLPVPGFACGSVLLPTPVPPPNLMILRNDDVTLLYGREIVVVRSNGS